MAGCGYAAVATISPSGGSVPENLLRIELSFDRPVDPPLDLRFVKLYDESGKLIADAFLDLALPGRDNRSVAIMMHPGRIKTDVGPNIAMGPALRAGAPVTLVINDPSLNHPLIKKWNVVEALRDRIRPSVWKINLPRAGTTEPLSINLPSAINRSSAQLIAVALRNGRRVDGDAKLLSDELLWRFKPRSGWKPGPYILRVHPTIEDPAGNRLCSAFEQIRQSNEACDEEAKVEFFIPRLPLNAAIR